MRKHLIFFIIAFILFCFVLIDIYWWIQISSDYSKSLEDVKREYNEKFPNFIGKGHGVALLNITLLAIASLLFYKSKSAEKLRVLSVIFLVCCIIIGLWQFFTIL